MKFTNKFFLFCVLNTLAACQSSSRDGQPRVSSADFTQDQVSAFQERAKITSGMERQKLWNQNLNFGCLSQGVNAPKYQVDPIIKPGMRAKTQKMFSIPDFSYSENYTIEFLSVSPFSKHISRSTSAGNDNYDYVCEQPDANGKSICRESNVVRDAAVQPAKDRIRGASCVVVTDASETESTLSTGTFTIAESGQTTNAIRVTNTEIGKIKCGSVEMNGSWRGVRIYSNELAPLGFKFCGGEIAFESFTFFDDSGKALYSYKYQMIADETRP